MPQIDAYEGNWLWEARVASSLWSGGLARRYYRQLMAVAEWPRLYLGFARDLVGEQPESRNTQRALRSLREMERPYLVLQRRFREVYWWPRDRRRAASHGSAWPARCAAEHPPAIAAVPPAQTAPGAAVRAPPGKPGAG